MRFKQSGKITEGFYVVGNSGMPIYMLDGKVPVLFDSGISALADQYERHIKAILGQRAPGHLLLTHSHFDHVGVAARLKRLFPQMQIAGSALLEEIVNRPRAIELIRKLNRDAGEYILSVDPEARPEETFEPFELDRALNNGESVSIGDDLQIEVLATPGHTRDFLTYWVPERRILVCSEAAGCEDSVGYVFTEFVADYDAYVDSLERLNALDPEVLCQGHQVVFTGKDAREHLRRSLEQTFQYAHMVEKTLLEEGGDIEHTVQRLKAVEWDPKPLPKQVALAYLLNTRARVALLADRMWAGGERGSGHLAPNAVNFESRTAK